MTINPDASRRRYTVDEYLEGEDRAAYKSEYHQGEIFAMVGATEAHVTISMNLILTVGSQLRGRACRPFGMDMRVMIDRGEKFYYPDLSIVCGDPVYRDEKKTSLTNPQVIFEILSESTATFDRDQKFEDYQTIPSLSDYLLIAQDRPKIEHFTRQETGDWLLHTASGLQSHIDIPSAGCTLALSDIYERLIFS